MIDLVNDIFGFIKTKFEIVSLFWLIVIGLATLMWADKHNNNDFVKWLEEFVTGVGGAYLGIIQSKTHSINGNGNGKNGNSVAVNGSDSNGSSNQSGGK